MLYCQYGPNLWWMFPTTCWIYARWFKESRHFCCLFQLHSFSGRATGSLSLSARVWADCSVSLVPNWCYPMTSFLCQYFTSFLLQLDGISHLWWAIDSCARNERPAGQMQWLKQTNTRAINWSSAVYVWLLVATNPQLTHRLFPWFIYVLFPVLHPKVAFLFRQEGKQENKAPKSVEDHPRSSTKHQVDTAGEESSQRKGIFPRRGLKREQKDIIRIY